MADENPKPRKRLGCSPLEMLQRVIDERNQAYEDVLTGKAKGRIDPDGSVTIIVDAISRVRYNANGGITYSL